MAHFFKKLDEFSSSGGTIVWDKCPFKIMLHLGASFASLGEILAFVALLQIASMSQKNTGCDIVCISSTRPPALYQKLGQVIWLTYCYFFWNMWTIWYLLEAPLSGISGLFFHSVLLGLSCICCLSMTQLVWHVLNPPFPSTIKPFSNAFEESYMCQFSITHEGPVSVMYFSQFTVGLDMYSFNYPALPV